MTTPRSSFHIERRRLRLAGRAGNAQGEGSRPDRDKRNLRLPLTVEADRIESERGNRDVLDLDLVDPHVAEELRPADRERVRAVALDGEAVVLAGLQLVGRVGERFAGRKRDRLEVRALGEQPRL